MMTMGTRRRYTAIGGSRGTGREEALHRDGDDLFLEDELDEGGVEIVSNFPVLLLLHDEFVCRSGVLFGQG